MTAEIDTLMREYNGAVPGASLLIVHDGHAVVRRAWGMADIEAGIKATPATNYRLASVTKPFTAAAILLLAEDRKLTLDDKVNRWLPSLPGAAEPVTIRHLLTHTAGLVDYEDVMVAGDTRQMHDEDVLALLGRQDTTYFTPGSSYRYSNSGYALLALIVEKASGMSFGTFLRQRIFMPLRMTETVAHAEGKSVVTARAYGYTKQPAGWIRKDQSTTSAVLGDGGIYSSIDDMAKWDAAWYDSRLLSDESRRLALTPHTTTDEAEVQYGYGWRITGGTVWHSGETSGFRNVIVRLPAQRVTVVILTNRDDPQPYRTALAIASRFTAQE
ncbi:MAG: serine hydrolase domain-containing protein [Gemmatimonadaceae bacterium]